MVPCNAYGVAVGLVSPSAGRVSEFRVYGSGSRVQGLRFRVVAIVAAKRVTVGGQCRDSEASIKVLGV